MKKLPAIFDKKYFNILSVINPAILGKKIKLIILGILRELRKKYFAEFGMW